MNILGFVPARKGSKGIPNKNLINLNGKPLISYTLEILKKLESKRNFFTFISTDDEKIKKYCKTKGFKSDYRRPVNLSTSRSNIVDTVLHGLQWFEKYSGVKIDAILLLQPTSPIRKLQEIIGAINYFKNNKIESLASVSPVKEHPYEVIEELKVKNKWKFLKKPKKYIYRRQDFNQSFYYVDGNFYIVNINFLKKHKSFFKKNYTKIFKLKRNWPVDIDNMEDLLVASAILKFKNDQISKKNR
jgi:CMP-N,N'-diacetyllegionaminic acid synthase